ncbi:hypothetical protein [Haloferula sp. BvORR071]|uniref:hypothetical protein n=1 Tax=Haloferula sp. BvORR071 TaxID=1396141 RepID=UPI002240F290|nr:hypothetical protein [Haloferula sp. BvORR071]
MKPLAIFDIETAPDLEAVQRLTPPYVPTPGAKPHAEADYWRGIHAKATLNPATSRIRAIGVQFPGEPPRLQVGTEAELLREFWQLFADWDGPFAYWSGNNSKGCFDPRFLVVRSWVRRVTVPRGAYSRGPGWSLSAEKWLDLAPLFLIGAEANSFCSANKAAKTLGLIGMDLGWATVRDKDALVVKAASFHEWLDSPVLARREAALDYLRNDLAMERAIAEVLLENPSATTPAGGKDWESLDKLIALDSAMREEVAV